MANPIRLKDGVFADLPALAQSEPAYCIDTDQVFIGDGVANHEFVMHDFLTPELPSTEVDDWSTTDLAEYISRLVDKNKNVGEKVCVGTLVHGVTADNNAYTGGVYDPTNQRIWLVPGGQADPGNSDWHYIDCYTGTVVAYAHGVTTVDNAYIGGVYSPLQNRIYFIPRYQGPQTNWHYIDCALGTVVAYAHGATVSANGYFGGAYSPTQNRIYMAPYGQGNPANDDWHYIDCDDGTVHAYTHGVTTVASAYIGATYSPTQNRIYFIPRYQSAQDDWHYIDCDDGTVHAYTHGATVGSTAYSGGEYSPTQNRIYLIPYSQADDTLWHYIDCADGTVVSFEPGGTIVGTYQAGQYCPTENRIYLAPRSQYSQAIWHYIDCNDGTLVAYAKDVTVAGDYYGAAYDPIRNRIYFSPYGQADEAGWHFIQSLTQAEISPSLAANTLWNKF